MPRVLRDIEIKMISLVRAGANQKEIIYKDESLYDALRVDFSKSDEELGVVYGIVYAPDETDTQGDSSTAEEIRKAAYRFMKNSNMTCVDVEHNLEPVDAYICESWIVKENDPFFKEVGAWAVGIKLESDELREAVKNGEIRGISMYGSGVVEKKSIFKTIKDAIKSIKKEETVNEEQIKELIKSTVESVIADIKKGNEERIETLSKQIAELEAKISKSKQLKEPEEVIKSTTGGIL